MWDGQPEKASQPGQEQQTWKELWQWHRVAHEMGRSVGCLQRITEVAREVVQGGVLSEKARVAMRQDLEVFERGRSSITPVRQGRKTAVQPNRGNEIE